MRADRRDAAARHEEAHLQQVNDALDALRSTVGVGGSGHGVGVRVRRARPRPSARARRPKPARRRRSPRPSSTSCATRCSRRSSSSAAIRRRSRSRALERNLLPWPADDFRYTPTFDEQKAAVARRSVADLRRFHASSTARRRRARRGRRLRRRPARDARGASCSATGRARRRTRACRSRLLRRRRRRDVRDARQGERRDVRRPVDAAQRRAGDYAALAVADPHPRRRRTRGSSSASASSGGLSYWRRHRLFQPASIDDNSDVRRLRDLRAAKPREGPRRTGEELTRAPTADSPSRKSATRRRRCSRSGARACAGRRAGRWLYRRPSSAARGRSRRRSIAQSRR